MNRHFEDTRYYLTRAATTAKRGFAAELEPAVTRVRELTGREPDPRAGRLDEVSLDPRAVRTAVVEGATDVIGTVCDRITARRRNER
ncbi:hypothetical protein GOC74_09780 [Halomicrobium mukohataei]|uniref:Uncharacterized protein n=1 Tax=Halomicrobium mukohataei TaxID=57705 RepID=A0A847UAZ8_9EURY|nr:hypothetical protein [Halomicrobium mukohataei]NLV10219.1 hypothetical protein [Halomicrobium mukohataei]